MVRIATNRLAVLALHSVIIPAHGLQQDAEVEVGIGIVRTAPNRLAVLTLRAIAIFAIVVQQLAEVWGEHRQSLDYTETPRGNRAPLRQNPRARLAAGRRG